jgi:hypothetical protein
LTLEKISLTMSCYHNVKRRFTLGFREAQNKRRFQINYKLAKSYFDSNYKLFMGEISNPLSFDMCWGNDAITLIRRFKMTLHK